MTTLKLADGLKLPIEAVTQKLAWLGTTGSGKTYGASKLAELFWDAGAQFVVLDPVGVWYGLRLSKDGKKPSDIRIPIFGGLHGDVPLEPTSGVLVADLIVDQRISAILDVSQFEHDTDRVRFATGFGERFFFRQKAAPSAVHVFLEECQEFVPENQQRGEERMKHVFIRLQKIGRNFGIGTSLVSQRPQDVAKKALNLAPTLFVFRTTGKHERKAIESWIEDKAIDDQDIDQELPKLETGAPHVWSPQWLKVSEVVRIHEKRTFNASATPEVGKAAQARELAQIDLEKIRKDMTASIEKAKAEDPKLLRAEIAQLRKDRQQLIDWLNTERAKKPAEKEKRVEVPVVKDAQIAQLEKALDRLATAQHTIVEKLRDLHAPVSTIASDLLTAIRRAHGGDPPVHPGRLPDRVANHARGGGTAGRPIAARQAAPQAVRDARVGAREPVQRRHSADAAIDGITEPQQRILDALAWWEAAGIAAPSRHQVAFAARYSVNGHFNNVLGTMRTNGLVDYPAGNAVGLTADGRTHARRPETPADLTGLIEMVRATLRKEPQRRIFNALVEADAGGHELSREALAAACNYSVNGHFNNVLGSLRSLGIVTYPRGNHVALGEMFQGVPA